MFIMFHQITQSPVTVYAAMVKKFVLIVQLMAQDEWYNIDAHIRTVTPALCALNFGRKLFNSRQS